MDSTGDTVWLILTTFSKYLMRPLTSGVANIECNKFLRSDYVDADDDGDNENEQFLGLLCKAAAEGCEDVFYTFLLLI